MHRTFSTIVILILLATVLGGCAATTTSKHTPVPSITAGPPTATPTTEQRITDLVQQAVGKDARLNSTTYSAQSQTVNVLATVLRLPTVSVGQEQVKTLCFRIQKALWLSDIPLKVVSVTIDGPTYGVYGDLTTSGYGGMLLRAGTAAKLDWNALSPDSAWADYNFVWLIYTYFNDS